MRGRERGGEGKRGEERGREKDVRVKGGGRGGRRKEGRRVEGRKTIARLLCLWSQEGVRLPFPPAQSTGRHLVSCAWQAAEEGDLPAINCVLP